MLKELFHNLSVPLLALAGLGAASTNIYATPIPLGGGAVLQISNMTGTLVGLSNACVNWNAAAVCTLPPTAVQDTVSGQDPAVFTVGSTPLDTIKNLPAGFTTPLIDFKTVQSPLPGGLVHFDLISVVIPAIPAGNNCTTFALSAVCNPGGGSPFILFQQTASQVVISFATTEQAYTGTSGTNYNAATRYNGIFTMQLSGCLIDTGASPCPSADLPTIPNILTFIAAGNVVTATWSSTESPVVESPGAPDLTITKSHVGDFTQGQAGATYRIDVTNSGTASTAGVVSVVDTLPAGLTATAMSGSGWTCNLASLTCTRNDVLAAAASYSSIILTVNVSSMAPASVTNTAVVSGGSEVNTSNDTANDITNIEPSQDLFFLWFFFS